MRRIKDTKDNEEILKVFSDNGFLRAIEIWYGEKINFIYGGNAIAWRINNKTNINLLNGITSSFAYLSTQKLSIYGLLGHEDGHKLFSDFNALDEAYNQMNNNCFAFDETIMDSYPNFNEFKNECHRKSVQNLWHSLANIIEDIYVEYRLLIDEDLRKKYGVGIIMNNERSQMLQNTVENDLSSENGNKFYTIHNALISYKAQERILWGNNVPDEIRDSINSAIDIIEDCCYCEDSSERIIGSTKLTCFLWDYIKEILPEEKIEEDNSNLSSNSSSQTTKAGNGNTTQSSAGTKTSPSGVSSKAEAKQKLKEAKEKTEKEIKEKSSSQLAKRAEGSFVGGSGNSIEEAQAEAREKHQQEVTEKTDAELIGTVRTSITNDLHKGVGIICQKVSTDYPNRHLYSNLKEKISPYISKMANALDSIQQSINRGSNYNYYGKKIVARRAYRPDLKVFETPKAPEKGKAFHLELLIDNSGSMCGRNIEIAKETACLLYEACMSMDNITINVTSHNTGYIGNKEYCVLRRCIIDDSLSPCGIMDLNGEGSNRDGLALEVISKAMLQQRNSEGRKIFIYINDGCPAAENYDGHYDCVLQELNDFSKNMEKESVIFLVAGIDGDKERLEKLYGSNHFLNIENLDSLPQRLSRILLNIIE
ncbi:MAG: hypothetical protein UE295_04750 [Acutalibacteraceae bacterium]|nr:hypothetical protein [Acutalibacteraceae bacterium]